MKNVRDKRLEKIKGHYVQ